MDYEYYAAIARVVDARHIDRYRVWIAFNDGFAGEVDLADTLEGALFEPLKDVEYFKKFKIEDCTLTWDNGADYGPDYLWLLVKQQQEVAVAK